VTALAARFNRVLRSPDLRVLTVMLAGVAAFGIVDGSFWKTLLTPTLAYRPAFLFGLALVLGWRALFWGQVVFFAAFASFYQPRSAIVIALLYLISNVAAFVVARRLAGNEPWLSREKSILAFLAGAALSPAMPALLHAQILRQIGIPLPGGVPDTVDVWLRGAAGILAIGPAVLVYGSGRLREWIGLARESEQQQPITARNVLELCLEIVAWSVTLWVAVYLKSRYGLNVTYMSFLPPLAFALIAGMRLTPFALAANAIVATTLWSLLHWENALSAGDFRLLIVIYSVTFLVLASVVGERQRSRTQIGKLLVTEAVLRQNEKHFRTLADHAPVMMWRSGLDKSCTFVNKQWSDFANRSVEQELGGGWAEGLHPEDAGRFVAEYVSAFDARRRFRAESRFRKGDGEYRWMLVNGVPLYPDGQFAGYIGSCVDITDEKVASERLHESESQLAYAQRLTRVGSFEWNLDNNMTLWSQEKLRMTGLSSPPADFAAYLSYVHAGDKARFSDVERQVRAGNTPVDLEYRIVRPGGEERVIRSIVDGIRGEDGSLLRIVGASQDVTDQVRARERLLESEQSLRSAQQLARVGSWHWDLDTGRIACTKECVQILGAWNYEAGLAGLIDVIALRDRDRMAREIKAISDGRREHATEFQIAEPGGEIRTITLVSRVSPGEGGVPRHVFGACQDITGLRRAQDESFERQKLETLGTMSRGIAHDFNNLLGAVMAQADVALAELDSGRLPREELNAIRNVTDIASAIVRELMIYSGTESEAPVSTDISHVVEASLNLLRVSVSKHATIETDLAEQLPPVLASPARISQLIMNLATNASDAIGDRQGFIRIATRLIEMEVPAEEGQTGKRGCVQLEVSDTGCGMSPETLARVREPFFTTKSRGRGLGLAVVDGIVRSLCGSIRIDSEQGRGARVRISLPCAEADPVVPADSTSMQPEPPESSRDITVLFVEDQDVLRRAAAKMLTRSGIRVIEASDGTAALHFLRAHPEAIDVLFLDITIPGASSREVFDAARQLRPEAKIIVASAYGEDVASAVLEATAPLFLRKPYRLAELRDAILQSMA